jgi:hypothetical protein
MARHGLYHLNHVPKPSQLIFDTGKENIRWENWISTCGDSYILSCRIINSNWLKDLDVGPETFQLLKENIGKTKI